jgi:UDP-N-acetyl-D-galactosamine dehydrogenase
MGAYVAGQLVKAFLRKRIHVKGARVLIMGLTFKENCPDLRNTRVVDVIAELQDYGIEVDVFDPWVDAAEAEHEYGITPISQPEANAYNGIVLAVAHQEFLEMDLAEMRKPGREDLVLYDLKYVLPADQSDLRL